MKAAPSVPEMSYDPESKKLTVRGAKVVPEAIFTLADPEAVEILDMSYGQLTSLPSLQRFKNLKVAFFSYNSFTEVPAALAECSNLEMVGFRECKLTTLPNQALPKSIRAVILTNNQMRELPRDIGDYPRLQKLFMTGNRLRAVPEELQRCQQLEIVRFGVNDLAEPPEWLFGMPRLAWYADSSNPFSPSISQSPPVIDWQTLTLGKRLGQSNNNVVHQARLQSGKLVAVKLFGASMVTDGLAEDDMTACLLAGDHPHVVGAIGKLVNTPNDQPGLVMPLVTDDFSNLGLPPSLTTITRDVYPAGQTFALPYVIRALRSVAAAMGYLHSRGIMHGDLYAHNILANASGESLVGDFGAASLYTPGSAGGHLRERVDVCAFGHLAEELITHCDVPAQDAKLAKLTKLRDHCLDEHAAERPLFAEIEGFLASV